MSVQVISQSLSDICLNLSQGGASDYFNYGLSSGTPFYGLQTTTLRTSDKIAPAQQVRLVFPTCGLLAPTPLIVRWSDTITRSATGGVASSQSVYNSLFCWKSIDLRSASNPIYTLTPHAILQFMSYTLSASAYTSWLAQISSVTLNDTVSQTRVCVLPLLLPSFTDASNLLDLKRSQSNYDLIFTMDAVVNWAGNLATAVVEAVSMNVDFQWVDLSEADEKNYVENTYLKSDSSLTKAQVVMVSDPQAKYTDGTAYTLTKSRLVEQIHFFFSTAQAPTQPVDVIAGLATPSVTINLGSGSTTIPLISIKSFGLFGNGRNLTTGIDSNIYTLNLAVAKNSSAFVGGGAMKSLSNAYISFTGLQGLSVANPNVNIFYSAKSIYRFSALSGVATEVSTS